MVKRLKDVSYGLSMTAHCFWWEVGDDFSNKCFEVTVDLHVVVKIIQREREPVYAFPSGNVFTTREPVLGVNTEHFHRYEGPSCRP